MAEVTAHLRRAVVDDTARLLEWVNDPKGRQASFQSEPITSEDHQAWFTARLGDSNTLIWLLEVDGFSCGMVRLERAEQSAMLSYLIASPYRERGLAAWIRPDNNASICALERAGFQPKPRRQIGYVTCTELSHEDWLARNREIAFPSGDRRDERQPQSVSVKTGRILMIF